MSTLTAAGHVVIGGAGLNQTLAALALVGTGTGSGGTPPPPVGARVLVGYGDTSWLQASIAMKAAWINPGGDYVDATGAFMGTTPYATLPSMILGNTDVNISAIDGDITFFGADHIQQVNIDGVAVTAWWCNSSSAYSIALPSDSRSDAVVFVPNPTRGTTMTIVCSSVSSPTVKVFKVAGPLIDAWFPYIGPSVPPSLDWTLELTSDAAISYAARSPGRVDGTDYTTGTREYLTDSNGIHYLRTCIDPVFQGAPGVGGVKNFSWRLPYFDTDGVTLLQLDEVWFRFLVWFEDDCSAHGLDDGVKMLAGISNETLEQDPTPPPAGPEFVVYRIEHTMASAANPGILGSNDYLYDYGSGGATPPPRPLNALFRSNRWHCIETHAKMNTAVGTADGIAEVKVNGHLTWSSTTEHFRGYAGTKINNCFANHYYGGRGVPAGIMHYRFAKFAMSKSNWCGVPPELLSPLAGMPPWRQAMPLKDHVYPMTGTAAMNGVSLNAGGCIDIWCGLGAIATNTAAALYSCIGGGHYTDVSTNIWQNAVYKIDLMVDPPRWVLLHPGSVIGAAQTSFYYSDGLPAACHTAYSTQHIAALNRMMVFGGYGYGTLGNPLPTVNGFNLTSNTWDGAGHYANLPFTYIGLAVAKHPTTEEVYISAAGQLQKWSPGTQTFGAPLFPSGVAFHAWDASPTIIDVAHGRNRMLCFGPYGPGPNAMIVQALDLSTLVLSNLYIDGNANGDFKTLAGAVVLDSHVVYDPDNDRFIMIQATALFAFDAATLTSTYLGAVTDGGGANVPPGTASPSTLPKYAYMPALKGIVYMPYYAATMQFIPTVNG